MAGSDNDELVFYTQGNEIMKISDTGNVGIGTQTPTYKLDVNGDLNIGGDLILPGGTVSSNTDSSFLSESSLLTLNGFMYTKALLNYSEGGNNTTGIIFGKDSSYGTDKISFITSGTTQLYVANNKVGIGTTSPNKSLEVEGTIYNYQKIMIDRVSTTSSTERIWSIKNNIGSTTTDGGGNTLVPNSLRFCFNTEASETYPANLTLTSTRVGILNTNPSVSLDIVSTDAIKVPIGTSSQRPTANSANEKGYIRFNTTLDTFEGFGSGNQWTELGSGDNIIFSSINNIPLGGIIMWSNYGGETVPTGFALCNGSNGTPDLRNRFIVSSGTSYNVGNTGGSDSVSLTIAQLPSHTHTGTTNTDGSHYHSGIYWTNGDHELRNDDFNTSGQSGQTSANRGDGGSGYRTGTTNSTHNHAFTTNSTGSGQSHENRPSYYALAFIMKISENDPTLSNLDVSISELNYLDGVSSSVQNQLDQKQATLTNTTNVVIQNITAQHRMAIMTGGGGTTLSANFSLHSPNGALAATGYHTLSDNKLKHNEIEIDNALQSINQLKPVKYLKTNHIYDDNYTLISDENGGYTNLNEGDEVRSEIGFIADEVMNIDIFKNSVVDSHSENDNYIIKSLNYNDILAVAVKAIQELQTQVKKLESRIQTLE
jgi:microcystin-dependent protein